MMSALIFEVNVSRLFTSARQRLYHLLFDPETVSGRRFEGLCGLFALISVIIIFIESAPERSTI